MGIYAIELNIADTIDGICHSQIKSHPVKAQSPEQSGSVILAKEPVLQVMTRYVYIIFSKCLLQVMTRYVYIIFSANFALIAG